MVACHLSNLLDRRHLTKGPVIHRGPPKIKSGEMSRFGVYAYCSVYTGQYYHYLPN